MKTIDQLINEFIGRVKDSAEPMAIKMMSEGRSPQFVMDTATMALQIHQYSYVLAMRYGYQGTDLLTNDVVNEAVKQAYEYVKLNIEYGEEAERNNHDKLEFYRKLSFRIMEEMRR